MSDDALILLVNDIPDHAASYVRALGSDGYRVYIAQSGSEALTLVDRERPDCVVIDFRVRDMTVWDLCVALRRRDNCEDLRIIVLTPDASRMSAERSAEVGCNAWLSQPSVAEDLVRAVRHVLELDVVEPSSSEEALLNDTTCPACGSERVRATLRISPIQYYCCRGCRFCWRMEVLTPARS